MSGKTALLKKDRFLLVMRTDTGSIHCQINDKYMRKLQPSYIYRYSEIYMGVASLKTFLHEIGLNKNVGGKIKN